MHSGAETRIELIIDKPGEVTVLRDGLDLLLEGTHSEDRHRSYQSFLERVHKEACHRKALPLTPEPHTYYPSPISDPNFNVDPTEVVLVKEASDAVVASKGVLGIIYRLNGTKRHARQMSTALSLIPSESV